MPSAALTRRQLLRGAAAGIATATAIPRAGAAGITPSTAALRTAAGITTAAVPGAGAFARVAVQRDAPDPYADDALPAGVRSRFAADVNGLRMHVLEAGSKAGARGGVLLLHGFPELAYSWRRLMPALAEAGYHVIAPDLRGYGRTDGTGVRYDDDLRPFRMLNEVRDSNRDVPYLSIRYTERLTDAGIAPSAGIRGDSYDDNALAESVIGLLKTALIRRRGPWRSIEEVELATLE